MHKLNLSSQSWHRTLPMPSPFLQSRLSSSAAESQITENRKANKKIQPSWRRRFHTWQVNRANRLILVVPPTNAAMAKREYHYVGPTAIRDAAKSQSAGVRITSLDELRAWLTNPESLESTHRKAHIATFTIDLRGDLLLAPRRSEHVACASVGPVLSAGEITFDGTTVTEITNQSTGFCPEPESWKSVATALDRIGVRHPGRFTTEIVFRLCPACRERNIVKDSWFYCALCDGKLPQHWNFPREANVGEQ